MKVKNGFTLVEMMAVIVIIGILATLAIVNYASIKEKTLDKETFSNLKMLQVAEKSYKMDWGNYYNSTNMTDINNNLKVFLLTGDNRNWNYTVSSSGCSQATRYKGPDTRSWNLTIDNDGDPLSGTCQ